MFPLFWDVCEELQDGRRRQTHLVKRGLPKNIPMANVAKPRIELIKSRGNNIQKEGMSENESLVCIFRLVNVTRQQCFSPFIVGGPEGRSPDLYVI